MLLLLERRKRIRDIIGNNDQELAHILPTLSEEYLQLAYIFIPDFSKVILHVSVLDTYFANCPLHEMFTCIMVDAPYNIYFFKKVAIQKNSLLLS